MLWFTHIHCLLTAHYIYLCYENIRENSRENLSNYLETNNLYHKNQHGFHNKHLTLSHLLDHFHRVIESLNERKDVDVIYLVFPKDLVKWVTKFYWIRFSKLTSEVDCIKGSRFFWWIENKKIVSKEHDRTSLKWKVVSRKARSWDCYISSYLSLM